MKQENKIKEVEFSSFQESASDPLLEINLKIKDADLISMTITIEDIPYLTTIKISRKGVTMKKVRCNDWICKKPKLIQLFIYKTYIEMPTIENYLKNIKTQSDLEYEQEKRIKEMLKRIISIVSLQTAHEDGIARMILEMGKSKIDELGIASVFVK